LFWAGAGPFYFGFGPVLVRFILCRAGAGPFHVRLVSAHFHVGPVLAHFVVCWAGVGPSFFMLGRAGPFQKIYHKNTILILKYPVFNKNFKNTKKKFKKMFLCIRPSVSKLKNHIVFFIHQKQYFSMHFGFNN
jgi:hypothetical protein